MFLQFLYPVERADYISDEKESFFFLILTGEIFIFRFGSWLVLLSMFMLVAALVNKRLQEVSGHLGCDVM